MATPKELRAALVEARAALQEALHGAHATWEQAPASQGEDAWSPKKTAEHVINADWYFTNAISQACGAPAVERLPIDVSTPATTAASLTRRTAAHDNILRHVSDADLSKVSDGKQSAGMSVEQMLGIMSSHMHDHANQIKAASA